jgi:hypothetical protein
MRITTSNILPEPVQSAYKVSTWTVHLTQNWLYIIIYILYVE